MMGFGDAMAQHWSVNEEGPRPNDWLSQLQPYVGATAR